MIRKLRNPRGFTLLEMAVVLVVFGIVAAFSVPALLRFNASLQLKGTVRDLAGQLMLARAKAMATGASQVMHFNEGAYNSDYHIHNNPSGQPDASWKFPSGVSYLWSAGTLGGSPHQVTMGPDGRASQSGMVILQNLNGLQDTINVQLSGLVLVQ